MTIEEIRTKSPFPWTFTNVGGGRFAVYDLNNNEVPLMSILELVQMISRAYVKKEATE